MLSTGIDIVEIARIDDILSKNPRFLTRFFGTDEQILFSNKSGKQKVQTVAGNFAAKEAFSKAMGTGISGFSLNEVQILRDDLGAPKLKLSGRALTIFTHKNSEISVSISHTDSIATAIVVMI